MSKNRNKVEVGETEVEKVEVEETEVETEVEEIEVENKKAFDLNLFDLFDLNTESNFLPISYLENFNKETNSFDNIKLPFVTNLINQRVNNMTVEGKDIKNVEFNAQEGRIHTLESMPMQYDIIFSPKDNTPIAHFHSSGKLNLKKCFSLDLRTIKFSL